MRALLAFLLLSLSCQSLAAANATGKTLDQFFIMASDFFGKAVIVDPKVDGRIKVYGVEKSQGFKQVFYSLLNAHNLEYTETNAVIRVKVKSPTAQNTVSNNDAMQHYVMTAIENVYITGSMGLHHNGKAVTYEYTFVQGHTRKTFRPDNIGLVVVPHQPCVAELRYGGFSTLVTCEPYLPEIEFNEEHERDDEIKLALNREKKKRNRNESE
ncbi:hypothetical protein [Enterovibrio norvegicus]|uniref:hypothetical protein n=1 Tax=Enterovibrio norvegicus TaxID=188144 RepID=UPI0024B0C185|nr:hypothetical protein [Enterovibrio norvegicus]